MNDPLPRCEEVILSEEMRGEGIQKDPCRSVIQVHHKDGRFIAESDPCTDDLPRLRSRIAFAEKLLRHLRDKHEALGDADRERIDSFFDPEPL